MSYKVKINIFEGPFDLLVYLIENAQMSIYDIRIAEITAQYLEQLELMKQTDVSIGAEFMVLAAELIQIKSRMILPTAESEEDGDSPEDPRSDLVQRLLEYKRFKAAAENFAEMQERARNIFEKPQEDISVYLENPDEILEADMDDFVRAFSNFLERRQRIEEVRSRYTRIERERQSAEEKIGFILGFFRRRRLKRISFGDLLQNGSRYESVLTFTSLLEMVRRRSVLLSQKRAFGEISVEIADGALSEEAKGN